VAVRAGAAQSVGLNFDRTLRLTGNCACGYGVSACAAIAIVMIGEQSMKPFAQFTLRGCVPVATIFLALTGWPSAGWSKELGCVAVTESRIADLFRVWNDALKTLDPAKVAETYAEDASLLPTVENGPLVGRDAIRAYFVNFLKKKPVGAIDGKGIIRIGCNVAFDIGLYTFTYGTGDPPTAARYTFVYEYDGGRWLIVHHHSSKRPE
jgi:uncharacterized protein (TIGR02246 family)